MIIKKKKERKTRRRRKSRKTKRRAARQSTFEVSCMTINGTDYTQAHNKLAQKKTAKKKRKRQSSEPCLRHRVTYTRQLSSQNRTYWGTRFPNARHEVISEMTSSSSSNTQSQTTCLSRLWKHHQTKRSRPALSKKKRKGQTCHPVTWPPAKVDTATTTTVVSKEEKTQQKYIPTYIHTNTKTNVSDWAAQSRHQEKHFIQ